MRPQARQCWLLMGVLCACGQGGAKPDQEPSEYYPDSESFCDPAGAPLGASAQGLVATWWSCMTETGIHTSELRLWDVFSGELIGTNTTSPSDVTAQPLLPAFGADGWIALVPPAGNASLRLTSPEGVTWWELPLGAAATTSPSIGEGDVIYLGDAAGLVHAWSPGGDPLWATPVGGVPANRIGIGKDGALYTLVRTGARFELVSLTRDGALRWRAPADVPEASLAILKSGLVLVPTYLGEEGDTPDDAKYRLRAISSATGKVVWEVPTQGPVHSPIEGPDGTIYLARSSGGLVRALYPSNGAERWRFTKLGDAGMPAALDNGWVVLGCGEELCALDANSGALVAQMKAGSGVIHSPLAQAGILTAPTRSGHYYVWNVGGEVATARGCWARFAGDDGLSGRAR